MILDIEEIGSPILRRKSHKVTRIDKEIRTLLNDMTETMREAGGIGLAAPQVGELVRLIVIEYPEDDSNEDSPLKTYKLVNPEIMEHSEETVLGNEGCLSIPGYNGEVERFQSVKIRAISIYGRPITIKAEGWLARVFQHEIDHLDGICYVDRTEKFWQLSQTAEEIENNPETTD